jgi:hypothetical protein
VNVCAPGGEFFGLAVEGVEQVGEGLLCCGICGLAKHENLRGAAHRDLIADGAGTDRGGDSERGINRCPSRGVRRAESLRRVRSLFRAARR